MAALSRKCRESGCLDDDCAIVAYRGSVTQVAASVVSHGSQDQECWRVGADEARPSSGPMPMNFMWRFITSLGTCFVRISAGLSDPGTFVRVKSPFLIRSWTQRSATCKCLILSRPRRRQMPIAAVASVKISTLSVMPKSAARD